MSNGPIQRDRDAHLSPVVSNGSRKDTVHGIRGTLLACGRKSGTGSVLLHEVTCADCLAARRADQNGGL